jgi:hypothetical protein
MAVQAPSVTPIVEAVVQYFKGDPERVRAFYEEAYQLTGQHPLIDAILNGIDNWLIEKIWLPRIEPLLHGAHKFIDPTTGEETLIDMDAEEWGDY